MDSQDTMTEKISATIEDYLGVMYILERDGEPIAGVRLAELLGVSAPTVTNTLKRMARDQLIAIDAGRHAHLTEHGQEAARTVVRRHMLAEWMLARMLSWSKSHREAHELEHAMSGDLEAALAKDLDDPELCPHGNPFPGHEDVVSGWIPLTQAPVGVPLAIRRIHEFAEEDAQVMAFLEANRIHPGQQVVIQGILPFNQTVNVCVRNKTVSLGFTLAQYVFAEALADTVEAGSEAVKK